MGMTDSASGGEGCTCHSLPSQDDVPESSLHSGSNLLSSFLFFVLNLIPFLHQHSIWHFFPQNEFLCSAFAQTAHISVLSIGGCSPGPAGLPYCGFLAEGPNFMGCCFLCPPSPAWRKYPVILTTVWPSIAVTPSSLSVMSLNQEQPPHFLPKGSPGGVHFLRKIVSKKKVGKSRVSWLGNFSLCLNECCLCAHPSAVIFLHACQACFLML